MDEPEEGQGSQVGAAEVQRGKPKNLKEKFKRDIVERCRDGAIVFIFISAVQFPLIVSSLSEDSTEISPNAFFIILLATKTIGQAKGEADFRISTSTLILS